MALRELSNQVAVAREESQGVKAAKDALQTDAPLSTRVRTFHQKMVCEHLKLGAWEELWKGGDRLQYTSYYRKDSYLLADVPYVNKAVMAVVPPHVDPGYYGVGIEGLGLLAQHSFAFLEALHPSRYDRVEADENPIRQLIDHHQHIPYYADAFEDALAALWIREILPEKEIYEHGADVFKNFVDAPDRFEFQEFLEDYGSVVKSESPGLSGCLNRMRDGPVDLPASLRYANLRADVQERILKNHLLSECLAGLGRSDDARYYALDWIMPQIEDAMSNATGAGGADDAAARLIFDYWHQWGTPWSYAEGGVVDYSTRDLGASAEVQGGAGEGATDVEAIGWKAWKPVRKVVEQTNIDDADGIRLLAARRLKYIKTFLDDWQGRGLDPWHAIQTHSESNGGHDALRRLTETMEDMMPKPLDQAAIAETIVLSAGIKATAHLATEILGHGAEGVIHAGELAAEVGHLGKAGLEVVYVAGANWHRYGSMGIGGLEQLPVQYDLRAPPVPPGETATRSTDLRAPGYNMHVLALPYKRAGATSNKSSRRFAFHDMVTA